MTCSQYQFLIGTEEEEDLRRDAALQEHLKTCAACTRLHQEMQSLSAVMTAVPPLTAPATFGADVSRRLQDTARPASQPWLGRFVGPLRAPAPTLQLRHALAGVAILVVVLIVMAVLIQPLGGPQANPDLQVPTITQPAGGQPVDFQPAQPPPFPPPPGHASP